MLLRCPPSPMTMNTITMAVHVLIALLLLVINAICSDAISPFGHHNIHKGWLPSNNNARVRRDSAHFLAVNLPRGGDSNASSGKESKQLVLIIDVDNTLYSEQDLLSSMGDGIESQIVRNTHLFGMLHFNLTSQECDELYKKYGSTVEGLRHTVPSDQVEETMRRFYQEVYDPIDFSCLQGVCMKEDGTQLDEDKARSGYDHGSALKQRHALAEYLKSIAQIHTVYLASNSPKAHIVRAINSMGLADVDFAGVLSPDMDVSTKASSGLDNQDLVYPTKALPSQYYKHILDRHPVSSSRIILLDDSLHNIHKAESVGIEGIHIGQSGRTLEEGLAEALGHILPLKSDNTEPPGEGFTFSDVDYLLAKNKVDTNAINPSVWEQLAKQLALRIPQKANGELRIADLGAGMLSMLELIMMGGGDDKRQKSSMLALITKYLDSGQNNDNSTASISKIEYFAYESNLNLLQGCKERLHRMGFQEVKDHSLDDGFTFSYTIPDPTNAIEIIVHLRPNDFQAEPSPPKQIDLIIGCCFADLFDPRELVLSLKRFAYGSCSPLVYFPITFAGTTQFVPAYPPMPSQSTNNQVIPSDTTAFRMYSESLTNHGHNVDPSQIVDAVIDHGGSLISKGTSNWIIDPTKDQHLFQAMLYFFGMSGAREMTKHHLDGAGWIKRCRADPRTIAVSNDDLLFHLQTNSFAHKIAKESIRGDNHDTLPKVSIQEIQFVAPYNVTTIEKQLDTSGLLPDQVEIESLASLISSGTELTIFKGSFQSAQLDKNIKGMSDRLMEYPLAYGYCLVGRVVACGSNVDDAESLIGRLVFSFSPHASRVITDRDAIQLVPNGIQAEDAIFMPLVETALSLVHDAHVRLGENVAVYGQGLLGLLVTSILSMQSLSLFSPSNSFGSVTTFDTLDDRLSLSSSLGATSALKPNTAATAGPFDVSIEVSGNPRALQSAIDNTSNNGRIVVGSWYGDAEIALKLGIEFHRSHKTLITSQVSTIPPPLAGLWSKERRFSLAWALVKTLHPSRLITKQLTLNEAQQAYELLHQGQEIAIVFKYNQ